ncbi:hypothetical protein ACHQM5_003571 [Ranunculus cassubicifolius]
MDASTSTSNSKKKKVVETEDKISALPDAVLHYILSFLPTKYVVGTSVLSTRWRDLWASVPDLSFDDSLLFCSKSVKERRDRRSFMTFVDRVLHLLRIQNVRKFSLDNAYAIDASRVNTWISTVILRNVQELILKIDTNNSYVLPHRLFTCESVKMLKIESDTVLNIPTCIHFPRLKVLHLIFVKFICHGSSQQVSLTMPTLEKFVLQDCEWLSMKTVNIFAPKLKTWVIDDYPYGGEDSPRECEINVYAESLVSLDLTSSLSYELSLNNFHSLVNASLDISSGEEIGFRASKLLRGIRNVKDLTLSWTTVVVLSHEHILNSVNALSGLSCLTVIEGYECIEYEGNLSVAQLTNLLGHLPNIESFSFTNGFKDCIFESPGIIPQRCLPHLKSVELDSFYGSKNELLLVDFLLRSSIALEEITIKSLSALSDDPNKQVKAAKELLKLPKSSKIKFVDFIKDLLL